MSDQNPTLAEIVALARSLSATPVPPPAPAAPENGILKAIATGLGALVLALVLWVGTSISSLNTTMAKASTTLETMTKQIGDAQLAQQATTGRVSDLQAAVAKNSSRIDAMVDDQNRVRERIRILEGQAPLSGAGG